MTSSAKTSSMNARRRNLARTPLDIPIHGDVAFLRGWSSAVPASAGVYFIRDLRGLLYIGRSDDLRRRFLEHLDYSHNGLLRQCLVNPWGETRFAWTLDPQPAPLEARLIGLLMPICNELRFGG